MISLFECASVFVKSFLKCCACKPCVCVYGVVAVHHLSFVHHILNLTFTVKRTGSKSTRTVAARLDLIFFLLFYFPLTCYSLAKSKSAIVHSLDFVLPDLISPNDKKSSFSYHDMLYIIVKLIACASRIC